MPSVHASIYCVHANALISTFVVMNLQPYWQLMGFKGMKGLKSISILLPEVSGKLSRKKVLIFVLTVVLNFYLLSSGINFTLPYSTGSSSSETDLLKNSEGISGKADKTVKVKPTSTMDHDHDDQSSENMPGLKKGAEHESDDDTDKWLDDMEISQDVTVTSFRSNSFNLENSAEDAKKSLVLIVGTCDPLSFFNFLINSKQFLVS